MKKVRILSVLIAVITLLTLCACKPEGGDPAQSSGNSVQTTSSDGTTASNHTTSKPEPTKAPDTSAEKPESSAQPEQTFATPAVVDGVYQLSTLDDLFWFMKDGPRDGKYALVSDIVFNDTANMAEWSIEKQPENKWNPVGMEDTPFTGTFNGNNHKISGLYILGAGNVGLFGVCSGATIENIIIESGIVYSTGSKNGAFIGAYDGESNVIRNCVNCANVFGSTYVGGIVGSYAKNPSYITVENCVNRGNVTGTKATNAIYAGGIIASAIGTQIKSCANLGTVMAGNVNEPDTYSSSGCALVGGIAAVMGGSQTTEDLISNCYNAGVVISCNAGANSGTAAAGGIVGRMNGTNETCKIENCYSTANVYTLSADSVQVSATCATKKDNDYVTNTYTNGKVLVWNTTTENTNAFTPSCKPGPVGSGIGAVSAMNFDPLVWTDTPDREPILSAVPAEYQTPIAN